MLVVWVYMCTNTRRKLGRRYTAILNRFSETPCSFYAEPLLSYSRFVRKKRIPIKVISDTQCIFESSNREYSDQTH